MKRKKILWIVAGTLLAIGIVGIAQTSFSLVSGIAGSFALRGSVIFIAAGGMVAAVASQQK